MQINYRIDKDYRFPCSKVDVTPFVVIADVTLPDGTKTTVCNPRDWEHQLLDDGGNVIQVIARS